MNIILGWAGASGSEWGRVGWAGVSGGELGCYGRYNGVRSAYGFGVRFKVMGAQMG